MRHIYCGHGIATSVRVTDNRDAMEKAFALLGTIDRGFIFVNLDDFDSKYGYHRNVRGYADALQDLDTMIPRLEALLRPGDEVIFTAAHGCDPTAPRRRPAPTTRASSCRSCISAPGPAPIWASSKAWTAPARPSRRRSRRNGVLATSEVATGGPRGAVTCS